MSATRHAAGTLLQLAADSTPAGASWWDVTSGLLLALAGVYATWAQFVYPKIVERRAKSRPAAAPPATTQAPTVDPVVLLLRDQQELIDDLRDELAGMNRARRRDAGTIARLTAELAACRSSVTPKK